MPELSFWVPGIPEPQGSTRPFRGRGKSAGKIFTTSANKDLRPWRNAVTWQAQSRLARMPTAEGEWRIYADPVSLTAEFYFPRPKGHFGKKGLLPSAPARHTVKPDLSKLVRAIEDSLTDAGVWHDDNQVTTIIAAKHYADLRSPGVQITVHPMPRYESQPTSQQGDSHAAGART